MDRPDPNSLDRYSGRMDTAGKLSVDLEGLRGEWR
jgi:hypothetical protein